jgi:hypothetical protein
VQRTLGLAQKRVALEHVSEMETTEAPSSQRGTCDIATFCDLQQALQRCQVDHEALS